MIDNAAMDTSEPIVYLIPVGLMMLERKDHKYLALGAMAGLISIPFAVLASLMMITGFNLPVRDIVSTTSPALHYLTLDFVGCVKLLAPLFVFCFLLAAGLRYKATLMVGGFLVFGKVMDAFIKIILARTAPGPTPRRRSRPGGGRWSVR